MEKLIIYLFAVLMMVLVSSLNLDDGPLTEFDEVTTEMFDGEELTIGWLKMISCTEGDSSSLFTNYYLDDEMKELALNAMSVKIVPKGSKSNVNYDKFAVIAKPNSSPVIALNKYKELSYKLDLNGNVIGYSDLSSWIGSDEAKTRLYNSCYGDDNILPNDFNSIIYHACNNFDGIHIFPKGLKCRWDYTNIVEQDMEIYFGYLYHSELPGCGSESVCDNIIELENELSSLKTRVKQMESVLNSLNQLLDDNMNAESQQ